MVNTKTIEVLNTLIATCRDGQAGYLDAAEHCKSGELKDFFNHQSLERAQFSGELENIVQHLGEKDPHREPSITNRLHRALVDLKQKLGGGDASILETVEAGEDNARKHFEDALKTELPADIRETVARQHESITAAHNRIREWRDKYKKAA